MNISRRKLIAAAAYIAPAVLTIKAIPSFASSGSGPSDLFGRRKGSGSGSFGSKSHPGSGRDLFMTKAKRKG